MKRIIVTIALLALGGALSATLLRGQGPGQGAPAKPSDAKDRPTFTILYTNNNIGYIEPCG